MTSRCNPYGYGTDAGPKHLMGGMYGPEYAGKQTLLASGTHGPAVCTNRATHRARLICVFGHKGPIMDLCDSCWGVIQARMSDCCTACVWPAEARELNEAIDRIQPRISEAIWHGDTATSGRLQAQVMDLGRQMDELRFRGIIRKVPLKLVEVS